MPKEKKIDIDIRELLDSKGYCVDNNSNADKLVISAFYLIWQ